MQPDSATLGPCHAWTVSHFLKSLGLYYGYSSTFTEGTAWNGEFSMLKKIPQPWLSSKMVLAHEVWLLVLFVNLSLSKFVSSTTGFSIGKKSFSAPKFGSLQCRSKFAMLWSRIPYQSPCTASPNEHATLIQVHNQLPRFPRLIRTPPSQDCSQYPGIHKDHHEINTDPCLGSVASRNAVQITWVRAALAQYNQHVL